MSQYGKTLFLGRNSEIDSFNFHTFKGFLAKINDTLNSVAVYDVASFIELWSVDDTLWHNQGNDVADSQCFLNEESKNVVCVSIGCDFPIGSE